MVADGLDKPVAVTHAGDGSGRLFVVEKEGRIRILQGGRLLTEPFLDISDHVEAESSERGLLGLAFHPDYQDNDVFYVNYTTSRSTGGLDRGDTVVARFTVGADANKADPATESTVLTVGQPHANHNGGHLLFGPDGHLYIGLGDGGSQGDPDNRAQDLSELLGKMLRIDVDTGDPADPYDIPPDNPFVDEPPARPEVWAFGFRNPWRYGFDGLTGELYLGDVGGSQWEEIDFQPAASRGGENYGWPILEAEECYRPAENCDRTGLVPPVAYYDHDQGTAITAGEVYRGRRYPRLAGTYFYGDYTSGRLWALSRGASGLWRNAEVGEVDGGLSAFGQGEDGEVYLTLYSSGEIHQLVDPAAETAPALRLGGPGRGPE
jgi:glucose/arabinose dehydrogenase